MPDPQTQRAIVAELNAPVPPDAPAPPAAIQPAIDAFLARERSPHASQHTDVWTWVAELEDGTAVWEMDEEGYDVHGLAAVPLERVVAFTLIPLREGWPSPRVLLDRAAGQRLIFTRRRRIEVNAASGEEVSRLTVHLLGYQQTVAGHNVKHLTYWFEDGSCLLSSDDQAC